MRFRSRNSAEVVDIERLSVLSIRDGDIAVKIKEKEKWVSILGEVSVLVMMKRTYVSIKIWISTFRFKSSDHLFFDVCAISHTIVTTATMTVLCAVLLAEHEVIDNNAFAEHGDEEYNGVRIGYLVVERYKWRPG